MTNQELERRLAQAITHTAPNDPEGVLSRCETRKGNVIFMTTAKRKNPVLRNLVAACLALALVGGGGGLFYQQTYAVASVVSLDVNPSIELEVNKKEKVLSCKPLNAEAREVLAEMANGEDLKDAKLDVAVNAIVGALVRHGYLDSISSAILISVEDSDQARAARLQQDLTAAVDVVLQERASEASVLSQTVEKSSELEKQAQENGISTGKASLINGILAQNSSLKFDALAPLSVEELNDLAEAGAPDMPIGREKALQLAMAYAGVSREDLTDVDVDSELDERVPHYDVELEIADDDYDYVVDAFSGAILSGQKDILSVPAEKPAAPVTPVTPVSPPAGNNMISESKAYDIAVTHFLSRYPGVSKASIQRDEISLDRDDGRLEYEVEFYVNGDDVDYEIDAVTGTILDWDSDYEPPRSEPAATTDIGSDRAKSIAFTHAGVAASQVSDLKVERDEDDGRLEYEIEFYASGFEYEYTIDAATGSILEHEKDWDD